jgi:hypothetical protein
MQTFIEALYKSKDQIKFGWAPEPGNVAVTYKMYVAQVGLATSMQLLYQNISAQVTHGSGSIGKVTYNADIADVRTILGLSSTVDFSNKVLYFTLTYVDSTSATSNINLSTIVEVPPVGITSKYMKDDPSINRHEYFFSNEDQKWIKSAGTSSGALITSSSLFYADNVTLDYIYAGDQTSIKTYPSDATTAGSPAKLTTYFYTGGNLTKVVTTDSTI